MIFFRVWLLVAFRFLVVFMVVMTTSLRLLFQALLLLRGQFGELHHKRGDFPNVLILVRLSEGGHSGHADAVLNAPIHFSVRKFLGDVFQVGGGGI